VDVCVIGAGYVGLVTGACLAYLGNQVIAVDADSTRIDRLKQGHLPFFEPGLPELVQNSVKAGRLDFSSDLAKAVKKSQVIFIAVGTPSLPNGEPDLSQVITVAKEIGAALDTDCRRIIVNKSTVPVGSGNWVEMLVAQGMQSKQPVAAAVRVSDKLSGNNLPTFAVVSNPEFLREGSAIVDSLYPDRIVVGSNNQSAIAEMRKLYEPIIEQNFSAPSEENHKKDGGVPFIVTDLASAELIKYAANAFLALKISFANEMAGLCEKAGADIREVTKGIGLDKRIGQLFLNAGIGWGGSCFGKDVHALIESAREYNYPTPILEATLSVNERQRKILIGKLQEELKIIKGRTIGLMGLSFKPNTDDLRDAPSLTIINQLLKMGAFVKAYDPVSNATCRAQNPDLNITYCSDILSLAKDCDAMLLVTEWDEFKHANWQTIAEVMKSPLIIDGRNMLPKEKIQQAGLNYRGIGH
jgi:UDPglucose 6-dehydrogenase